MLALRGAALAFPAGNPTTGGTGVIDAAVQAGDLLYVSLTSRDHLAATAYPTVTDNDTGGNTWTRFGESLDGSRKLTVWRKRATSGTAGKTITIAGCVGSCAAVLKCFSGGDTGATPETNIVAETNASANETHAGFTPTNADSMICAVIGNVANDNAITGLTCTTPGAFTSTEKLSTGGSDCANQFGHALQSGGPTATGAINWTQATDGISHSIVWAIAPAAATVVESSGASAGAAAMTGAGAAIAMGSVNPAGLAIASGEGAVVMGFSSSAAGTAAGAGEAAAVAAAGSSVAGAAAVAGAGENANGPSIVEGEGAAAGSGAAAGAGAVVAGASAVGTGASVAAGAATAVTGAAGGASGTAAGLGAGAAVAQASGSASGSALATGDGQAVGGSGPVESEGSAAGSAGVAGASGAVEGVTASSGGAGAGAAVGGSINNAGGAAAGSAAVSGAGGDAALEEVGVVQGQRPPGGAMFANAPSRPRSRPDARPSQRRHTRDTTRRQSR